MIMKEPLLLVILVLMAGGLAFTLIPRQSYTACTLEAKLCPDGSYVGRTGPNCEFTACPSPSPTPSALDCNGPGDRCASGYTCIQKCGPPVARENDPPPGYYCGRNEIASQPRMCPICLASNTRIATPDGEVNVKEVTVGMRVWSVNARGEKAASTVLLVSHTDAPKTHRVVHLVLSDSRELWVSPNHPSANGLLVGSLRSGDAFDGAIVRLADLVLYWDEKTYDFLPDSDTGSYVANGILLGSTLFSQ